jgi:LysM repeat protein
MAARNRGRYLAPLALVAVLVAIVLVVRAGTASTHHATVTQGADRLPVSRGKVHPRRFYVVRGGDTLSTISVKTGVAVSRIESLNPSVYPNALQTGERLRLR